MDTQHLNLLDSAVADIEGISGGRKHNAGGIANQKTTPYHPTTDSEEALRLMDKYISRVVKLPDGWVAVGPNGRACLGQTLPIAVCVAIVEGQ